MGGLGEKSFFPHCTEAEVKMYGRYYRSSTLDQSYLSEILKKGKKTCPCLGALA